MTLKEKIKIMEHYENGGKVDYIGMYDAGEWRDCPNPIWDWSNYEYRIKPQWKPRKLERVMTEDGEVIFIMSTNGLHYCIPRWSYSYVRLETISSDGNEYTDYIEMRGYKTILQIK